MNSHQRPVSSGVPAGGHGQQQEAKEAAPAMVQLRGGPPWREGLEVVDSG